MLRRAAESGAILATQDEECGELAQRQGRAHAGVLLVRLRGVALHGRAVVVAAAIERHGSIVPGGTPSWSMTRSGSGDRSRSLLRPSYSRIVAASARSSESRPRAGPESGSLEQARALNPGGSMTTEQIEHQLVSGAVEAIPLEDALTSLRARFGPKSHSTRNPSQRRGRRSSCTGPGLSVPWPGMHGRSSRGRLPAWRVSPLGTSARRPLSPSPVPAIPLRRRVSRRRRAASRVGRAPGREPRAWDRAPRFPPYRETPASRILLRTASIRSRFVPMSDRPMREAERISICSACRFSRNSTSSVNRRIGVVASARM